MDYTSQITQSQFYRHDRLCNQGDVPEVNGKESQHTAKVREASWWAIRLGCSCRGMVLSCRRWMSSMLPISMLSSFARASAPGKLMELKEVT